MRILNNFDRYDPYCVNPILNTQTNSGYLKNKKMNSNSKKSKVKKKDKDMENFSDIFERELNKWG